MGEVFCILIQMLTLIKSNESELAYGNGRTYDRSFEHCNTNIYTKLVNSFNHNLCRTNHVSAGNNLV